MDIANTVSIPRILSGRRSALEKPRELAESRYFGKSHKSTSLLKASEIGRARCSPQPSSPYLALPRLSVLDRLFLPSPLPLFPLFLSARPHSSERSASYVPHPAKRARVSKKDRNLQLETVGKDNEAVDVVGNETRARARASKLPRGNSR